jgi:hypothetical protein
VRLAKRGFTCPNRRTGEEFRRYQVVIEKPYLAGLVGRGFGFKDSRKEKDLNEEN